MARGWTGLLGLVFLAGGFAGCGGYTNENTPVKVVTDEEIQQMHETNKRIAEMGVKGVGAPPKRGEQNQ